MAKTNLTAAQLREILRYDPETGAFYRLKNTGPKGQIGPVNVRPSVRGGYVICVLSQQHHAHRLAWLYMTGEWPRCQIDHIDGNPLNNAFDNLREATDAENKQNKRRPRSDNTSGYLGVYKHGQTVNGSIIWRARVQVDGKSIHVGLFKTPEEAYNAYVATKRKVHPFCTL